MTVGSNGSIGGRVFNDVGGIDGSGLMGRNESDSNGGKIGNGTNGLGVDVVKDDTGLTVSFSMGLTIAGNNFGDV